MLSSFGPCNFLGFDAISHNILQALPMLWWIASGQSVQNQGFTFPVVRSSQTTVTTILYG